MDIAMYEELKNLNYTKKASEIMEDIRGKTSEESSLFQLIQLSYLALSYKFVSSERELVDYLDSEFDDEYILERLNRFIQIVPFDLIKMVSSNYEKEILKAIILFAEDDTGKSGLFGTPRGITKLVNKLLDIKSSDTVLDLGSGIGSYLLETKMSADANRVLGVEINIHSYIISKIRGKVAEFPIDIKLGNILNEDYREFNATKVFSNPPVGMREPNLNDTLKENKALTELIDIDQYNLSADWAFILNAYANQKTDGKTAVLMSNQVLFKEPDREIREKIISAGWLEAIVALPEKLFPYTSIPFTLLVFSANNDTVKMVDASEISTRDRKKNILSDKDIEEIIHAYGEESKISKQLTYEDFKSQEFVLTPNRYFGFVPDASKMTSIDELSISVNRGAMITRKDLDEMTTPDETGIKYLKIQDIENLPIVKDLPNLKDVEEKYHNYFLEDGDIVISKSHPYKIARVEIPENEKILATGNLYYLHINEEKINPTFVEMYLKSAEGQAQLERLSTGSVIETISIKNLKAILIPNVSRKEQDSLVNKYLEYEEQLFSLDKQKEIISQKRKALIEKVL